MSNRFWLTSDLQQRRRFGVRKSSSRHRQQRIAARLFFGVTLIALVLLLSACHTLPSRPCEMPPLPTPPALSQPMPPVSYLLQSQQSDENSQKKLTGTSMTSK